MGRKSVPLESLIELKRQLEGLPLRSPARLSFLLEVAKMYEVSASTIYRQLTKLAKPSLVTRKDKGIPRSIEQKDLVKYCEAIAAIKVRTTNKSGRHLSTSEAIRLLENGIYLGKELIKVEKEALKKTTVNRFLNQFGLNPTQLEAQRPVSRFQAQYSNECWQFDLSPSDLKNIEVLPDWIDPAKGRSTLMLFSVVDDRSGVAYQEYRVVHGEDVIAALKFLFNAMSDKNHEQFPFKGIPKILYTDNGPISKSAVFRRVMNHLGIEVRCHMPRSANRHLVAARSKGKVERPFRTIKEMHETLYHFNKPKDEEEANQWLFPYLIRYSQMLHRSSEKTRMEDWVANISPEGIRDMCSWSRFASLAREPLKRTVSSDCTISLDGIFYSVDSELIGKTVIVWSGLLENDVFVECNGEHFGPFQPIGAPLELNKYKTYKKTEIQRMQERIEKMSRELTIPRENMATIHTVANPNLFKLKNLPLRTRPFEDPDPFHEIRFSSENAAKKFIAATLGIPLGKLPQEELDSLNAFLTTTLDRAKILEWVHSKFQSAKGG